MKSQCQCEHNAQAWSGAQYASNTEFKPYPVQPNPASFVSNGVVLQPGMPPQQRNALMTNFHEAVGSRKIDDIEDFILKNPAVVHERGFNGQMPLHRACLRGDANVVRLLLKNKSDPNVANDFDETPLHFACKRSNLMVIHELLAAGADIRAEDKAGKGAMHHCAHGGSVLGAHYLSDTLGLGTSVRDRNLSTPMHVVCTHGHIEAFDYFLKKERCDVFSKDAQGNTLLHIAASNGNGWMCWRLLQVGGHRLLHELNADGSTALDLAKRGTQPKYKDIIKMLVYYTVQNHKTGSINGPVVAWYGLLVLPLFLYPLTILLASCFTNKGPMTLFGLVAMVALRLFHSHRMNHATKWPSPAHAGMFAAGLLYTTLCHYFTLLPYLNGDHWCMVALTVVLSFVVPYMYYLLFTKDPGVCQEPRRKSDIVSYYTVADIAMGSVTASDFCHRCEIIRPLWATHCKLCDVCYIKTDHHCLYLYRCIAINNHHLFIVFNIVVMLAMFLFEYACVLYIQLEFPTDTFSARTAGYVFAAYPIVWSLFLLNAGSLVWGIWVLKVQLDIVSKGGALSFKTYMAKSHLTRKQRFLNVVHFLMKREPYARDVFSA